MTSTHIYYQNVRGLRTKASDFFCNVTCTDFSIFCITETWLCPEILSGEYFSSDFLVHRSDRDLSRGKKTGGGVLIAHDRSLKCNRRADLETYSESVWVELEFDNSERVLIGTFYFPPYIEPDEFNDCLLGIEGIADKLGECKLLVIGDFNVPGVCWETHSVVTSNYYGAKKGDHLVDFASFMGLNQFSGVKNSKGAILDLCFSDIDNVSVIESGFPLVPSDKYHPALEVAITLNVPASRIPTAGLTCLGKRHNFAAGDYVGLYNHFSNFDWSPILQSSDVNYQVLQFTRALQEGMDNYIPLKKQANSKFPYWFSPYLKKLLKKKSFSHRKFKKTGSFRWEAEFIHYRRLCKQQQKIDHKIYVESVESDLRRNPRKLYRHVRSRGGKLIHPDIIMLDEENVTTSSVCDLFARHFSSVYKHNESGYQQPPSSSVSGSISSLPVDEGMVQECIKKLKPTMSSGHDGIPAALVKAFHEIFTPILYDIFNNSLRAGVFPDLWRRAVVVPVYKSGSRTTASNYRPVSLLCTFSKLFEMVVHKTLSFRLKNLISSNQHGFVSGRSTTTNLISFMSIASKAVCNRGQLDVVYFDLSKAFDVVDHSILLSKLCGIGVCGVLHDWFQNYLSNRTCVARANGAFSFTYRATSGVPQGSVLGPLLFSIFVNDVCKHIVNSSFLQYADDIKIFKEIKAISDCRLLQEDINSFGRWCSLNGLLLNSSKTKVMSYSRKTQTTCFPYSVRSDVLCRASEVRDLGVLFDSSLRFDSHVARIITCALRALGVVCRVTRVFGNPATFVTLYRSLTRSQLEHASPVWNGGCKTTLLRLERVQNKFLSIYRHRYLRDETSLSKSSSVLDVLHMNSLHDRREKADLFFFFKVLHGMVESSELLSQISLRVPRTATRLTTSFYFPRALNILDPMFRMGRTYNSIASHLDIFCVTEFVRSLRVLYESR